MSDKKQPDVVRGYVIQRSIVFENNRGIALAENPKAVQPFVTWMFTEGENGKRDYEWGHYTSNLDTATRDYELRIAEYTKDYGISERDAYKYYSMQRPVDVGTFPKTDNGPVRIVNFERQEGVELGHYQAWGYLVYDAPLTEKQIDDYELKAAPSNPDIKARMREQAQIVGAWEEKRGVPVNLRFTQWMPEWEKFIIKPYITPEQMAGRYDQARDAQTRAAKKPIAEQLKENAEQAARDNANRQAPGRSAPKTDKEER